MCKKSATLFHIKQSKIDPSYIKENKTTKISNKQYSFKVLSEKDSGKHAYIRPIDIGGAYTSTRTSTN